MSGVKGYMPFPFEMSIMSTTTNNKNFDPKTLQKWTFKKQNKCCAFKIQNEFGKYWL